MNEKFPDQIPIFPLSGVIYFPKTNLPLNIFEKRYLDLVNDAIKKDKLMGMIQSRKSNNEVYKIGCLGKISDFQKNKDGRVLINLTGLTRFEVLEEKKNSKLYREFKVNYKKFIMDLKPIKEEINIEPLMDKVKIFFKKSGLLLNWKEFSKLDEVQKINTLAMIAPITNEEKQKLLESISLEEKVKVLINIVNFYLHEVDFNNQTLQ
ncbi:LON peptidase substrate-binding domain-containing protein [Pelagibacterales bacterium SAG-MED05]|nr:LON peptidase substrate-binding domain-containing protein [Pelagibacterales bacterium SAG-MED05]